jgi:hypothetical protein
MTNKLKEYYVDTLVDINGKSYRKEDAKMVFSGLSPV